MSPKKPTASEVEQSTVLGFDFVRASLYRNIHADGVFGGITPRGEIYMAVFTERPPMPSQIVHEVREGHLGPEKREKRVISGNIERELETGITMSPEIAQIVVRWLQNQIEQVNALEVTAKEQTEKRKA